MLFRELGRLVEVKGPAVTAAEQCEAEAKMLAQTAGITILHHRAQLPIVTHQDLAPNVSSCSK